jgi:hypothetical protein
MATGRGQKTGGEHGKELMAPLIRLDNSQDWRCCDGRPVLPVSPSPGNRGDGHFFLGAPSYSGRHGTPMRQEQPDESSTLRPEGNGTFSCLSFNAWGA